MGNVSAARAKAKGNAAFQARKYEEAVSYYTEAISHDPSDVILYSNRSASYACLEEYAKALQDGQQCVSLNPDWARGYARKGLAELFLCRYDKAISTYKAGLALAPTDPLLLEGLKEVKQAKKEPFQRGMVATCWHGKTISVPYAIANSRVSNVFQNPVWPAAWPYSDADFRRENEHDDALFYKQALFAAHLDDEAIAAIRRFYALLFAETARHEYSVLDVCATWSSHYPSNLAAERVAITGMNEEELKANEQATEFVAKDLNKDPTLPFGSREFDFISICMGIEYLTRPSMVFREMHRVMKPGGVAIISFSNRCCPEKAISMWLQNMDDGPGHCQIIGNYFHFNPDGGWDDISALDLSPDPRTSDPMWVVIAVKARVDSRRVCTGEAEAASEAPTDLPFSVGVSEATSERETEGTSCSSQSPDHAGTARLREAASPFKQAADRPDMVSHSAKAAKAVKSIREPNSNTSESKRRIREE